MERVIAFVPARGGSKSIPLKNIKNFCGKPLIYWCLSALEKTIFVNEIIVATDSDEIEKTVLNFNFHKVKIYRRSDENASDTASTESVMLEYISKSKFPLKSVFILVQLTSPLTETHHFEEAINLYLKEDFDSLLTCVRNYRFFWNDNGTSKNYDYLNRPRRQDFKGELMENGAFYINSIENILKSKNRLSGKIGIYEMPAHTSIEIDEPDDWIVLENLMLRHKTLLNNKIIKLFLSDIDGVLTDGGMYYTESGDELKKFNTRDGMGFELLRNAGIKTGLVTSENTKIAERRASKLKVDYLYQSKKDGGKLAAAKDICEKEGINLNEVAYIGDDLNCYELLLSVGVAACPSDAAYKIRNIPGIKVLNSKGGEGAVREFVEIILNK